jgi:hypothetical protein
VFRDVIAMFQAHRQSREVWSPREGLLGRDRRIFQRIGIQIPCRMDSRLFGLESHGKVLNLSLGGVGLVAPVTWPEGSQVRVFLEGLDLRMEGLIVFRAETNDGFRYGVKFQRIGVHQLMKVRRALRQEYRGPLIVK